MQKFVLASASPRRSELLQRLNLDFCVIASDADETIDPDIPPDIAVLELSIMKTMSVVKTVGPGKIVIGADTVVVLDNEILGKPKDIGHAKEMLKKLSGRTHEVYTGFTVTQSDTLKSVSDYEVTKVTFKPLSDDEIDRYVKTGEPLDKAGAYGIQELGSMFVERICGDYFNVMGLPVCKLCKILTNDFEISVL